MLDENMNTDTRNAQAAMFKRVQAVDPNLGRFICFLYSNGTCEATHQMDDGTCMSFRIDIDTEDPWQVAVDLSLYIMGLAEPQMATGPDGRWVMHEGAK